MQFAAVLNQKKLQLREQRDRCAQLEERLQRAQVRNPYSQHTLLCCCGTHDINLLSSPCTMPSLTSAKLLIGQGVSTVVDGILRLEDVGARKTSS